MIEIAMPLNFWVMIVIAILIGGKALQNGGVLYGRGQNWVGFTLLGIGINLSVIMAFAFLIMQQNFK